MNTNTELLVIGITALIIAILFWKSGGSLLIAIPLSRYKEIERAEDTVAIINELRSSYGASVEIHADNDDPDTKEEQCVISVIGDWTQWNERTFYGESVLECLRAAMRAKGEAENIGRTVKL